MQEMEKRHPLHFGLVAIEKGAFGSLSTTVTIFTYFYLISVIFLIVLLPLVWI